jgi:uncharacterized membrane protein YphA (DoxX/SURF4 family)
MLAPAISTSLTITPLHRLPNELTLILGVTPLLTAVLLMAFTLVATLISQSFWEFTEAAR